MGDLDRVIESSADEFDLMFLVSMYVDHARLRMDGYSNQPPFNHPPEEFYA
jgi:hypothetical protein